MLCEILHFEMLTGRMHALWWGPGWMMIACCCKLTSVKQLLIRVVTCKQLCRCLTLLT
jgi:hypothetical protein